MPKNSKNKCSVVGCENEGFILCNEHNALSEQNKDKPIHPTNIRFFWGEEEIKPEEIEPSND